MKTRVGLGRERAQERELLPRQRDRLAVDPYLTAERVELERPDAHPARADGTPDAAQQRADPRPQLGVACTA